MTETENRVAESLPVQVPAETARAPTAAEDVAALRQRAERAERESVLRRALAGVDWFDPEDAYRELSRHAECNERGEWEIALPDPNSRERKRVAPEEAARSLAARKPHWVRARVQAGSGANGGDSSGSGVPAGFSYGDLLKPEHAERLRDLIHNRPRELERLRAAHYGR